MALLAIDPSGQDGAPDSTDVIPPPAGRIPARPVRRTGQRSRLALAAACAGALGCVGAVAGAGYLLLSGPSFLAGFAFSPGPGAPKREAIRMGRVPDMPEIRNGVPELVARPPVRVIQAAASPTPAPPSDTDLPRPAIPAPVPVSLLPEPVSTSALPPTARLTTNPATGGARTGASLLSGPPSVPAPAALVPGAAETPPGRGLASVPLPPPAPRTALAKAPAAGPSARPAPQKIAAVQAADARPDAAAEDDHVDVFGVSVPTIGSTGRKLRDAVGALGDAFVSLPGKF